VPSARLALPALAGAVLVLSAALSCASPPSPRAARGASTIDPADHACGRCHAPVLLAARAAKVQHAPARDGDCDGCHAPHPPGGGSASFRGDACLDCHDLRDAAHAHMRYAVPASRCLRCHVPHGAAEANLLAARPHDALPDCTACHAPPDALDPFDRASPEPDLCLACHDGPHGGEPRPACTGCHDPHFPSPAAPGWRG
jgi:predicted CXXCH cytochrome family protein